MSFEVYLSVCLHPCAFSCMCCLWSAWHPLMEIQGGIRDDTGNRIETNTLICNREENADDWAIWPASSWGSERRDAEREERKRFLPIPVSSAFLISWIVQTAACILKNSWHLVVMFTCVFISNGFCVLFQEVDRVHNSNLMLHFFRKCEIWLPLWTWMTLKSSLKKQLL